MGHAHLGDKLTMDSLTSALDALSSALGPYLPRFLGAATIVVVAWLLARVLRGTVARLAASRGLDERLGSPGIGAQLANVVYWLVWLLALPALLEALQMQGLLAPVQAMLARLLGFLPNLVGAVVVFGIGFIAAQIVRQLLSGVLRAAGSERVAAKLGLSAALGKEGLAGLVGLVAFVLILLPVVVGALQPLGLDAVTAPLGQLLATVMALIPRLIGAGIVIVVAALVGRALASIVTTLLTGLGFNKVPAKLGLTSELGAGGRSAAELAGVLVMAAVMMVAITQACEVLGFAVLTDIAATLGLVLAKVVVAALLMAVGLWLANLACQAVRASALAGAHGLGTATKVAVLFFAAALTLRQAGLPSDIVTIAFASVIGALALGVALAIGLGGQRVAGRLLRRAVASFDKPGARASDAER